MLRRMCIAKIHRATITACHLDYEGSIQVDQTLMEAAGIFEHEMVLVANLANGERFETYVICGPKDTGVISLNGAASRLGAPGDKVIIMSVAWMEETQAKKLKPQFVQVDSKNHIIDIHSGVKKNSHALR